MYTVLTFFLHFLIACIHQPSFFVLTHCSHLDFNVYILVFSRFRQNGRKLLLSAQRRANSQEKIHSVLYRLVDLFQLRFLCCPDTVFRFRSLLFLYCIQSDTSHKCAVHLLQI